VKRLAYEIRPASVDRSQHPATMAAEARPAGVGERLPRAPGKPASDPVPTETLTRRIDEFLATRGFRPPSDGHANTVPGAAGAVAAGAPQPSAAPFTKETPTADFVCEEDVRDAARAGRKIRIGDRTIITPAARDLGETQRIFEYAGWRP
jgi:hypothetical protein